MQKSQIAELIVLFNKNKSITNQQQQSKLIDSFINKSRSLNTFPPECKQIFKLIQELWSGSTPSLKSLQLIRLLSRDPSLRKLLTPQFLIKIHQSIPQLTTWSPILVQILTLHLRYIQINPQIISYEMMSQVLDLLVLNHPQVIRIVIQITSQLTSKGHNKIFEEVWYVGRLLLALERLDPQSKPKLINLIKDLLDCPHFNQNFRKINGVTTLINQLRKSQNNLLLKLSILNAIYRLLLTTKVEVIYQLKLHNLPSLMSLKLKEPFNYKETILILKIITHLMLDNDINAKYIQEGLEDAIALFVRVHPTNCHLIKFEDIEQSQQKQAFQQFSLLLLRLLRYVSSFEKNRKVFKRIFPSELLEKFIDVGHFVKPLKAYLPILKVFNGMSNSKVIEIEDQFQKITQQINKKGNQGLKSVGNYTLLEQLGQGAFGCVYLAKKGSNQYALKRIKIEGKQNLDKHFREVEIYKELKHPNIVKFYQSFTEDGYLYIVMEVVKGCNLSELVRNQNQKGTPFQEQAVWKLLIAMLSVLRYLHVQKKVIHRDLNPSNIMIDHKLNLKVADFGLAKSIGYGGQMTQSFVGTLIYSCPQIVQNQQYSEKADIWSLGCIIYELLTLRPPFSGTNALMLAKNIVNQEFVATIPQSYSADLRDFVRICLTKQESERPNVIGLLQRIVERLIICTDDLRQKQASLSDAISHLSKKMNSSNAGWTNNRNAGTSHYGKTAQDFLRQTQLVKMDSEILSKIGEDPMIKFIDIVKKLSLIASTQAALKKNFKKFVVDSFYNRVIISDDFKGNDMKNQLYKLINLHKQQVTFLGVKFQLKQNYIKSITYEMLYFYIEQLYEVIKKS